MVTLILIYAKCGWVTATVLLVGVGICSGLSAGFLCEAMTRIEGNENFGGRVEMMGLAQRLLQPIPYYICLTIFFFNLMITNIAAIVESAQTMDSTFIAIFGKTCSIQFYPTFFGANCVNSDPDGVGADSPFGDNTWVLSMGFVGVAILAIPLVRRVHFQHVGDSEKRVLY